MRGMFCGMGLGLLRGRDEGDILRCMKTQVKCSRCGFRDEFSFGMMTCRDCRGPLDVVEGTFEPAEDPVTLGEGNTPVVRLRNVGKVLGMEKLYAKLEFLNPTGSFKDRGSAVLVSALKSGGIRSAAEDSSGNAGASIAAYCAQAGIEATIFAPEAAPPMKLQQIGFYGARIVKVPGGRSAVAAACRQYCIDQGVVYASHNLSPLFIEGTSGFASEVASQMKEGPEHVLFPVGNGSLLIGAWKGFKGMGEMPKLHCIQSMSCMPIVSAIGGKVWTPPEGGVVTVAGGIAVERPPRQHQVLEALAYSGGEAVAVAEENIVRWQRRLSVDEGLFVEPTSASVLAGLELMLESGKIGAGETTLLALTGFGFKDRIP